MARHTVGPARTPLRSYKLGPTNAHVFKLTHVQKQWSHTLLGGGEVAIKVAAVSSKSLVLCASVL